MIRIVIVEDMPIVRKGMSHFLNHCKDFVVVGEYANGKEFLNDINKVNFNIVLTDIEMPEMGGVELTKKAIALVPGIKIIALTMHQEVGHYQEMINAGAKGFIFKQLEPESLRRAIIEVNKGGNYFSAELIKKSIMSIIDSTALGDKRFQSNFNLSARDIEMLKLMSMGFTNNEIAKKLFVSVRTIETAKSRLLVSTNSRNSNALISWAFHYKIMR